MKYPPPHHQDPNKEHMLEVIKSFPLATAISVKDNIPYITHMPLVYRDDGKLIGHIDLYNPQVELLKDDQPITLIFSGPQCYISPSVYSTTQLPTWNYIKVHLKGRVKEIEDQEIVKNSLIKMTEFLEGDDPKFVLKKDNPKMSRVINYIKGFLVEIDEWEGKFKLSQDKKKTDRKLARERLIQAQKEGIRQFLDRVFLVD